MLYADFESILEPVDGQYREKMNKIRAERKGKTLHTEKISTHVPSGCCVHNTIAYGHVPDPLKLYRGKDCVEKFIEDIEDEVKRLYSTFPQQPKAELTDVLKREDETAESIISVLKSLTTLKIEK